MDNISDEKKVEEIQVNEQPKPALDLPQEKPEIVEIPDVDVARQDQGDYQRSDSRGGYRSHDRRSEGRKPYGEMSFEEKFRAFKKQSEERLLHIKRSREAKIGKKKTR